MNLAPLYKKQKILMERIEQEHPEQPGEKRFEKKILAAYVEISECANEYRVWKYWSFDQEPRTEKLLEEYVDGFHFVLELGVLYDWTPVICDLTIKASTVVEQFLLLYEKISDFFQIRTKRNYFLLLEAYVGLGQMLGFSYDQIENAYLEKHEINLKRQETGY